MTISIIAASSLQLLAIKITLVKLHVFLPTSCYVRQIW